MTSNMSLLRKADLAIADLQADGGVLSPEQGNAFIRKLIQQPTLVKVCRTVEMLAPTRKINKIGFGSRILRKAQEATALTPEQRSAPSTSQIQLNTEEQIAEVRLPYDVLEDNIERATTADNGLPNTGPGGLRQTLIDLIAERAALDIEELALKSDTAYTNPADADDQAYISQFDGWYKIASTQGHVVDAANQTVTKTLFKQGLQALPSQYQRNKAALNHFVSVNNETEYRDSLSDRSTDLGDMLTQGVAPVYAYGSPVKSVALMPETEGMYTDPLNLIFGIQRQMSMEFDKDITARVYIIVLTCRVAVQVEEPDAIVAYENIQAAA